MSNRVPGRHHHHRHHQYRGHTARRHPPPWPNCSWGAADSCSRSLWTRIRSKEHEGHTQSSSGHKGRTPCPSPSSHATQPTAPRRTRRAIPPPKWTSLKRPPPRPPSARPQSCHGSSALHRDGRGSADSRDAPRTFRSAASGCPTWRSCRCTAHTCTDGIRNAATCAASSASHGGTSCRSAGTCTCRPRPWAAGCWLEQQQQRRQRQWRRRQRRSTQRRKRHDSPSSAPAQW